jgi:hypothetical protein
MKWSCVRVFIVASLLLTCGEASADSGLLSLRLGTAREEAAQVASLLAGIHPVSRQLSGVNDDASFRIRQADRTKDYAAADPTGKRKISESIGEQGRKRLMTELQQEVGDLVQKLGFRDRFAPQGPDSSYWSPATGKYLVVEAKGGNSRAKKTFGAKQGTNLNTLKSAANYLAIKGPSFAEKVMHAEIIEAAIRESLATGLAKTKHVGGKPEKPVLEGPFDESSVSKEAKKIKEQQIKQNPELKEAYEQASRNVDKQVWKHRLSIVCASIGLVAGVVLSWDAYVLWQRVGRDARSEITDETAITLALLQATGRTAEVVTISASSAAKLALAMGYRSAWLVEVARVAGRYVLPVVVLTESAFGASAGYDHYFRRETSKLEFFAAASGPTIALGFSGLGAIVGAFVGGVPTGGAGAVPGAIFGAEVGAFVSVPFVLVNNLLWSRFFDGHNLRVSEGVEQAVRDLYR